MTIPVWVLLCFAGWTVLLLTLTIGISRWGRILAGRSPITDFRRPDTFEGSDFYKRAMRAHANCVENLPVYGAVVVAVVASGVDSPTLDTLAIAFMGARVLHTLVHVVPKQVGGVLVARFSLFVAQLVCVGWMGIDVALSA